MSDEIFLGNQLSDLDFGKPSLPVSKVILNVDSETYYQAGDDTGSTIEADCPWATQEMADNVYAKMKGFVYKPFNGYDALLDPSAEVGDGITVGGERSILAMLGRNLDRQAAATVGAPGTDEIEDEYPYKSKERKRTDRALAKAYAKISKTADEIRLEVAGLSDQYTALAVTLDGVTITDSTGTTRVKGNSIETDTLYVNAANIKGSLKIGQLPDDVAVQDDIPEYISDLYDDSDFVNETGVVEIIDGVVTADYVNALGVSAQYLQGKYVYLMDSREDIAGRITVGIASTADYAIDIASYSGLRLLADAGMYFESGYGTFIMLGDEDINLGRGDVRPSPAGYYSCGTASWYWSDVYSENAPIEVSDRSKKTGIVYGLDGYDRLFDGLKPGSFLFKGGSSGRRHFGLIAQDVEETLTELGYTTLDVAAFIKSPRKDNDGNVLAGQYEYALRYGEFISLLIDQVQKLKRRVAELEAKV